ncbi:MAG: hypothetical protein RLY20_1033 [Verrucomicrobiota bacterium]
MRMWNSFGGTAPARFKCAADVAQVNVETGEPAGSPVFLFAVTLEEVLVGEPDSLFETDLRLPPECAQA